MAEEDTDPLEEEEEGEEGSLAQGMPRRMVTGVKFSEPGYLQVVKVDPLKDKYLLWLSDGHEYGKFLLASRFNHLVQSEKIVDYCIVEVTGYKPMTSNVQDGIRKTAVISDIDVIQTDCDLLDETSDNDLESKAIDQSGGLEENPQSFGNQNQQFSYASLSQVANQAAPSVPNASSPPLRPQQLFPEQPKSYKKPSSSFPKNVYNNNPQRNQARPMMNNQNYVSIKQLSPYTHNWTIKGIVIFVGEGREFNKNGRMGHVWSFGVTDDSGVEIQISCFNEDVKTFRPLVEKGKIYAISKGRVQTSKNYVSIKNLNPYNHNWTIKAMVVFIGAEREWNNARGSGSLWSFGVTDDSGSEIEITCFGEEIQRFKPNLEKGKIYAISKGKVKTNTYKRRFDHEYSIVATRQMTIVPLENERVNRKINFVKIENLSEVKPDEKVNIMGVVTHVADLHEFTAKSGKQCIKREVTIVDDSNSSIVVTMWSEMATKWIPDMFGENPVVAFHGASVKEWNGGLSANANQDPELEMLDQTKANVLRQWWNDTGKNNQESFALLSNQGGGGSAPKMGSWFEVEKERKGAETPESFQLIGTITQVMYDSERPPWYKAEPNKGDAPATKVVQNESGKWYSEKTQQEYDTYEPRWILRIVISDTGTKGKTVTLFGKTATNLLGITAQDAEVILNRHINGEDSMEWDSIFTKVLWSEKMFRIKAKMETYGDTAQIKYTCESFEDVKCATESKELIKYLANLNFDDGMESTA